MSTTNNPTAGRFASGRPFARRVGALRCALLEGVGPDDVREVMLRLIQMARGGDIAAARLLLQYTVGRPAPAVEPGRLDVEEPRQ